MTLQPCTYGGSTSVGKPCTPVGSTSQSFETADLAPFFVQHQALNLVPPSVQHTLHPRWFNNEYPYLLTHSRHALSCKTDVSPYRNFTTNPETNSTTEVTNRPRARMRKG